MTFTLDPILVIDDEEAIRRVLQSTLEDEGYLVKTVSSGEAGLKWLETHQASVVLLDIWMPGQEGLSVLQALKHKHPDPAVVMMSGHGTIETAVKATKLGAFDFLEKPLSLEKLLVVLKNALTTRRLTLENQALRHQLLGHALPVIGRSSAFQKLQDLISKVAPTRSSVLILGENGTGKEWVAHRLHQLSPRVEKPWIALNCAAIPDDLIESELFGHERGAFTGASQLRRGRFDLASGGTLFLDEIGDMSLKTQAKLLRVLQEQRFERVGGSETIRVDVRILAATNKDLTQEMTLGRFREDLYYRLNVVSLRVPPLRERREDVAALAHFFLAECAKANGLPNRNLTQEASHWLEEQAWPGNIRELKNKMERIFILTHPPGSSIPITVSELQEASLMPLSPSSGKKEPLQEHTPLLRNARQDFERDLILKTLEKSRWNISQAAQKLGIERTHLHRKIKALGLSEESS